jgi:hypothetical protein
VRTARCSGLENWWIVSIIMLLTRDDRRAGWDLVANTVEVDERALFG